MLYSKTCEYAIRSLACLASKGRGAVKSASEMGAESGVPVAYVSKIFQSLVRKGFLKSSRGVGGGVTFCEDPKMITVMQIIDAVDDLTPFNQCAMGLDRCEDANGCPLHEIWKKAQKEIIFKFKATKLTDLTKRETVFRYGKLNRMKLKLAM